MKKLSIVIPCHNEADNLPYLIEEIEKVVNREDIEIILVNDGSMDSSAEVLERLHTNSSRFRIITNKTNQGYGGAILSGLSAAEGTYLGWMHGDLQTPLNDVLEALKKIEALGQPVNIYIKGLRKGRSLSDTFFTFGMSIFESILLKTRLHDVNAQPNIFHRSFFERWDNPPKDFSLDLFAFYMARTQNIDMVRIPVTFPPRPHGTSHWNTSFLAKIKFIRRTIKYSFELEKRVSGLDKLTFIKYLIAGGIGTIIHLFLLFTLTDIFEIHYLVSTAISLFTVFWLSFYMQKYWTFTEYSKNLFWEQSTHYFIMHTLAFVTNIALMYIFVDILRIWYLLSQAIITLGIAIITYIINKKVIFALRQ